MPEFRASSEIMHNSAGDRAAPASESVVKPRYTLL
jgi:hypothetical protein